MRQLRSGTDHPPPSILQTLLPFRCTDEQAAFLCCLSPEAARSLKLPVPSQAGLELGHALGIMCITTLPPKKKPGIAQGGASLVAQW